MGLKLPGMTLERLDNDGPYNRENCRWASRKQQQNNRRGNRLVTYQGKTLTITQWAECLGIHRNTLEQRFDYGWPLEKVFSPLKYRDLEGLKLGGIASGAKKSAQTHCKRGHPLSGDNIYIQKWHGKEYRVCRACHAFRERQRRYPIKHGLSGSPTYLAWSDMKRRCLNPDAPNYPSYGGRGITICERWLKFENFLADIGEKPPSTSLERIDNNGPYSPENCCWANRKAQDNNKRTNRLITFNGETRTIKQWADYLGLKYSTLIYRLKYNWPLEKALCRHATATATLAPCD
jgi:hypothetical protein